MDFAQDNKTIEIVGRFGEFMDSHIYPAEDTFEEQLAELRRNDQWSTPPVVEDLKAEARRRGLWNFFLPGEHGAGLTNLQYAPLSEMTGRSIHLAPTVVNCSAPDTGNMELLSMFATEEQAERWLKPLLAGEIRSAFAMSEPAVASSDATNIGLRIDQDGDDYVLNGRKWYISGAMNPAAKVLIVMGKTDPGAARHQQQSMILVPRDTDGVNVRRSMTVMGYDDRSHGGHAEIDFVDVRVPMSNILGKQGSGFAMAQARLGPGRIHHCMRHVGMAERALDLMCERVLGRVAFGRPLSEQGVIRQWIAEARVRIEQLRLLVLKTAWLMDTVGNKQAHTEIQAIKIATPAVVEWVLEKAMQAFGAAGLSQDVPLASWWAENRSLRIADGPDEVHRNSLAKRELARFVDKRTH